MERSPYQIIWLLAQERSTQEVADITGYSRDWIYELVRSYHKVGVAALGDLRRNNVGAAPKRDALQQAQLRQALEAPAPDGGCGMVGKSPITSRIPLVSNSVVSRVGLPETDGVSLAWAPS